MSKKVIIVGLGSIGRRHLKNLKMMSPEMEIAVLRQHHQDKDLGELNDLVSEVFFETQEALNWKPNVAFITNPAPFHVETALSFARENIHLFIEKPLSDTLEGIDSLLDECQKRNLVVMLGYVLRFFGPLKIAKEALDKGCIGRLLSIRATAGQYLPNWRPNTDYRKNVSARKDLGGGIVFELSHEIDYLRWLGGEIQQVQACLGKISDFDIDVEDVAEMSFRFTNGAIGHIHLDMVDHARNRDCRIVGTEGTLVIDVIDKPSVRLFCGKKNQWIDLKSSEEIDRNEMFVNQFKHFFECVKESKTPVCDGREGRRIVEIVLAAKRSSQTGEVMKL